jgi:hypothetical protein
MKTEEVAQYLQSNPQFFEDYADMLADVTIPHPHGGRTISLSERQMLTLREKNKVLEKKLHELIAFGSENDALQQKLHQFTLTLFGAHGLMGLQDVVTRNLREIFAVPHAALHVWKGLPPSAEVLAFTDQQTQPVCTHHAVHDTAAWFGEAAAHLRSFAYLPLRNGEQSIGLLVLASEDAQRFYPEMGTVFLQRIAETVSGALQPHL